MKKPVVILIILCAVAVLAWAALTAMNYIKPGEADEGKPKSQEVSVGDKVYDIEKLAGTEKEASDKELPKVGTMENLMRIFSDMGLFYSPNDGYKYSGITAFDRAGEDGTMAEAPAQAAEAEGASDTGSHSSTNIQVENVDEADIIKTDGEYIYYACNGQIAILRADGKNISTMSVISGEHYVNDIYIVGDKLIAVTTRYENAENGDGIEPYCRIWLGKTYTCYIVYDIADKSNPAEFRRVEVEGNPLQTRLIENTLYFVNNKFIFSIAYGEKYDESYILPCYRDTAKGEEGVSVQPEEIYYCPGELQNTYLMVGAFDVNAMEPCEPEVILGSGSTIYMNLSNLYVVRQDWNYENGTGEFKGVTTEIYRFSVDGASLKFSGSAEVPGYVINQYSMDEYNGYFRIATTTQDKNWNEENNVYILNSGLEITGSVTGLAEGETIQSVRFSGDTGYVVTYEQMDPLFVLDLSNPASPKVLGELKIPGFSSYLHYLGEGMLLGIGRHTTELYSRDDNGVETVEGMTDKGLKISIFDVTDPRNPVEVAHKVLGSSWSTWSEAQYNPRSLMVDIDRQIVGIPVSSYGADYIKTISSDWNGYVLAGVGGGDIDILANLGDEGYYYGNQRLVYIGDTLYLASNNTLTAYSYRDFTKLGGITIGFEEPQYPGGPIIFYDTAAAE
jgi:inhibitor of cysteine peptidase